MRRRTGDILLSQISPAYCVLSPGATEELCTLGLPLSLGNFWIYIEMLENIWHIWKKKKIISANICLYLADPDIFPAYCIVVPWGNIGAFHAAGCLDITAYICMYLEGFGNIWKYLANPYFPLSAESCPMANRGEGQILWSCEVSRNIIDSS